MKTLTILDPTVSPEFQQVFLAAVGNNDLTHLINRIIAAEHEIIDVEGRARALQDAVVGALGGQGSVADLLRERVEVLRVRVNAARDARGAVLALLQTRRDAVAPLLSACARLMLDTPREIDVLQERIRDFEQAREARRETLRVAGLDDSAIERAGIKPDAVDLAAWKLSISEKRDSLERAKAFLRSGPAYDEMLLSGEVHAVR